MRQMKCKVEEVSVIPANGQAVRIAKGQVVDFDAVLSEGFTLGHAIAGREECFEPVAPAPSPVSKPTTVPATVTPATKE